MRSKLATIGIIVVTIILAGVAIFTARQLYVTRDQAVAPNVPSSKPFAQEVGEEENACSLSFTIATPSPSPSPTPSISPSPSPSPSPVPLCNSACTSVSQCPSGMTCYIPTGSTAGNCRNASCLSSTSCVCATVTPSPSPSPSPSPTPVRTPSPTPVITASPSPVPQCNSACTSNSQCTGGMICYIPSGQTAGNCRNPQCLSGTDCACAVVVTTTPPAEPSLPVVGTSWPTIVGSVFGIIVILGSLLLAL